MMDEKAFMESIERLGESLPRFDDGRIDYSGSSFAPVTSVFIRCGDEFLLLKRSERVNTYRGKWNTVAGYLDEPRPIREKVAEELSEELGLSVEGASSVRFGEPYEFMDESLGRTWFIHPVLVEFDEKPEVVLDWEHTEYRWVRFSELGSYDKFPKFMESLRRVLD
ncbi:MAG: NUDIX domain-containing protein [Candidatus Altiarchaeota archaeon]